MESGSFEIISTDTNYFSVFVSQQTASISFCHLENCTLETSDPKMDTNLTSAVRNTGSPEKHDSARRRVDWSSRVSVFNVENIQVRMPQILMQGKVS
jgi:hypothetical protein